MKSEPKSELKDMDDSDTKSEENLKPDKNCINECGPNEQCCVCSNQCNLEPEDQELLHSLDALVGCENRGNCKVEWWHAGCVPNRNYMNAEWRHFDKFYCSLCENDTDRKVRWYNMNNKSLQNFAIDNDDHNDFEPLRMRGIRRKEDGLYYDKDGCEVFEVGTQRFVDVQLRKYGPDSNLPKAEKIYDHGNDLISSDYLEKHGWDTIQIGSESIQRPYYYRPEHRIKDQIKAPKSFGPESTIESSLKEIERLVGPGSMLKHTDSQTQEEYPAELGEWIDYFTNKNEKSERFCRKNNQINKRFNVISMEFTKLGYSKEFLRVGSTAEASLHRAVTIRIELTFLKTKLRKEHRVQPPQLIQNISWTDLWPETSHDGKTTWDTAEERPSFQHYCLMGTKGSFTHWHIDLGGTTVWYHIHRGKKVFLLVPPTSKNLKLYKEYDTWHGDKDEFGEDEADAINAEKRRTDFIKFCHDKGHDLQENEQLYTLTLTQGSTVILPGGWIHCVFTPEDSLVFGGNCLHSFSTEIQTKIFKTERKTTEKKYRLNGFTKLHWYAAQFLRKELKKANQNRKQEFSKSIFEAIVHIYYFLKSEFNLAKKKKNLEDIPSKIAPEEFLEKLEKEILTRQRHRANQTGQFIEDNGKFREPDIKPSEIGRETDMTLPLNIISKKDRPEKSVEYTHVPFSGHPDDDDFDPDEEDNHRVDDYEYEEEDFEADDDIPREEDEDFESDDDYNPVKENGKRKRKSASPAKKSKPSKTSKSSKSSKKKSKSSSKSKEKRFLDSVKRLKS